MAIIEVIVVSVDILQRYPRFEVPIPKIVLTQILRALVPSD